MQQPVNDRNFADHPIHGVRGQHDFFNAVMRHVRKRRTAIDVGAHIGTWTLLLSTAFKEVYAFEPVDENFECLKENTKAQHNVARFQLAVGAHSGTVGLTLGEAENSGMWRVQPDGKTKLVTLDKFGAGMLTAVDFIKIDVEGFEGFVVSGAREIIERDKPMVLFEDNGLGQRYYESDWLDPKEVLEVLGYYRVCRIRKDELWAPRP